ncbi:MAG: N-acetylneuraminate synthase family protein, partial [Anaerolineales bacterium]
LSDHTLVARDGIKASIAAMSLGADIIERHFTILAPEDTKDGPVSIRPEELRRLVAFSKMSRADLEEYVRREIPEFRQMIGQKRRSLSHIEELNRDYYRGRFASRVRDEIVYNWEDRAVF